MKTIAKFTPHQLSILFAVHANPDVVYLPRSQGLDPAEQQLVDAGLLHSTGGSRFTVTHMGKTHIAKICDLEVQPRWRKQPNLRETLQATLQSKTQELVRHLVDLCRANRCDIQLDGGHSGIVATIKAIRSDVTKTTSTYLDYNDKGSGERLDKAIQQVK